jgi:hypothetical protein
MKSQEIVVADGSYHYHLYFFHKSNHKYISWGCGNGHTTKQYIIKIRYNIVIFKYQEMQNQQ